MFDRASGAFRHKNEASVKLRLTGAPPINARIFHTNGERLTDLLNDPRAFIPVRTDDGEVMIVAKTQIASIIEQEESAGFEPAKPAKTFDPYAMLKVSPEASLAEIRAAYKARIKAVHPDSLASLGLDDEITKAAHLATLKVNYAYQKITRERETAEKSAHATA